MNVIVGILLVLGYFLILVAGVGVLRLPDFYSRLHASGESETLGVVLMCTGLAVYEGLTLTAVKILMVAGFVLFANPTGTHIISRAAYISGLEPWKRGREQERDV